MHCTFQVGKGGTPNTVACKTFYRRLKRIVERGAPFAKLPTSGDRQRERGVVAVVTFAGTTAVTVAVAVAVVSVIVTTFICRIVVGNFVVSVEGEISVVIFGKSWSTFPTVDDVEPTH